eukprot:198890-Chlamydomonas_euryale.AAC.1
MHAFGWLGIRDGSSNGGNERSEVGVGGRGWAASTCDSVRSWPGQKGTTPWNNISIDVDGGRDGWTLGPLADARVFMVTWL